MKSNDLIDIIGEAADEHIRDAKGSKKKVMPRWAKWSSGIAACLVLVLSFAIPFIFDRGQSSEPLPGGVTAEVVEVIDNNTWKVLVTGGDSFYSIGDYVFVTWEKPFDSTEEYSLSEGDEIAVTYTNREIFENKDGSTEILAPEIEIIKKAE